MVHQFTVSRAAHLIFALRLSPSRPLYYTAAHHKYTRHYNQGRWAISALLFTGVFWFCSAALLARSEDYMFMG